MQRQARLISFGSLAADASAYVVTVVLDFAFSSLIPFPLQLP